MPTKSTNRALVPALLAVATLAVAGGFGLFLSAQGRTDDFVEFLLDRREGLGQTTPDRGADCSYQLGERSMHVTRKAHGQTVEQDVEFVDEVVEGFFGGQEALIETGSTAETYNCTNGEHLTHELDADDGNPISRVLFSTSGRNVAVVINRDGRDGKESAIETLKFKVDPGQSVWNEHLGSDDQGLTGQVVYARLVGESLLTVVANGGKLSLHTYNFRSSHKANPWNGHDPDNHKAFTISGKLDGEPEFVERGKKAEVRVRSGSTTKTYTYDFTCKLLPPEGETVNPKPCEWTTTE